MAQAKVKGDTTIPDIAAPSPPAMNTAASPSSTAADSPPRTFPVSSLQLGDILEAPGLSPAVCRLLENGLALTRRNLSYLYGSDDPANGGMDCSGTIFYLLRQAGLGDVPRDSAGLYRWVWQNDRFRAVVSPSADSFELQRLRPGDLLFWTGTYRVDRDPPVTHVMLYLGTSRTTGRRVMLGASEGRTFNGKPRFGVSVFDFKTSSPAGANPGGEPPGPVQERESRFIGYGSIPGLESAGRPKNNDGSGPVSKGSL
jgi:hypothetical protein